jgi:hypothetical protein
LLVDFERSSLKRSYSFERASGAKTFEAIDEYQGPFKLAVDEGC